VTAEQPGVVQDHPPTVRQPDVARDGVAGEHECPDRRAGEDVEQGGVATLVRGHVGGREGDMVVAAVAVHG
jgi:hypothetical protein